MEITKQEQTKRRASRRVEMEKKRREKLLIISNEARKRLITLSHKRSSSLPQQIHLCKERNVYGEEVGKRRMHK